MPELSEQIPVFQSLRRFRRVTARKGNQMQNSDNYIHALLPVDFYEKIESGNFKRHLYPVFADRKAWEKASKSKYASRIIQKADEIKAGDVPQLLFSCYCQFNINGDRKGYEQLYFARRANLAYLALAMCLSGDKEKYMSRLMDHAVAILEEWNWCLPAHIKWNAAGPAEWHFCDLFCAETGAVMAQLHAILADELDKEWAGFSEIIREKTLQRTVYNVLYSGREHWWLTAEKPANWTVWCCYNNLLTAFYLERDPEKLSYAVKKYLESTSRFIFHYAADGYCTEGPTYYNKANLMVFRTVFLLHRSLPGCMDKLIADPKIKAMVEFIANVRIGGRYQLSFGDAQSSELRPDISAAIPAGKLFHSRGMLEMSCLDNAALGSCGDHINESLALLFDQPEELPQKMSVGETVSLFKDRLVILRSDKFSVALKAGYNDEPHNHNDLGHFSIFDGETPIVVDAGTGAYARINFSKERYTLWNTRGAGHNAPVFGEFEQIRGEEYKAGLVLENDRTVRCDLSRAYPVEAGVKHFERILDFSEEQVVVEDTFSLTKTLPAVITLHCKAAPEIVDSKTVKFGNVTLLLEGIVVDGTELLPDMILHGDKSVWGGPLTALRLRSEADHYKLIFKR